MEFDWDEGNSGKSFQRHGIHDWEIEEAFEDPGALPDNARNVLAEKRWAMLARCETSGRYMRIIYIH